MGLIRASTVLSIFDAESASRIDRTILRFQICCRKFCGVKVERAVEIKLNRCGFGAEKLLCDVNKTMFPFPNIEQTSWKIWGIENEFIRKLQNSSDYRQTMETICWWPGSGSWHPRITAAASGVAQGICSITLVEEGLLPSGSHASREGFILLYVQ